METIHVNIEMEPHQEDLSGEILNRPAPRGGAFLIRRRIELAIWEEMRDAGAWHWSEDDLEDFSMFHSSPGWRYPIQALRVLLEHGYELAIEDEAISSVEDLDRMFAPEARRAFYARKEAEHEERLLREKEHEERLLREKERKGAEYEAWRSKRIGGLEQTYSGPGRGFDWGERIAYFDRETPGAWYTTGDVWYEAEVSESKVYRREYGNTVLFYAPRQILDAWILTSFQAHEQEYGSTRAARYALYLATKYPDGGVIGAADAIRVVELLGKDELVQRAASEEWFCRTDEILNHEQAKTAREHGIEPTLLREWVAAYIDYDRESGVFHPLETDSGGRPAIAARVWRAEDGRLIGETYGGTFFELTHEQESALGERVRG